MNCKILITAALAAALVTGGAVTAFAAETGDASASYGYLAGKQRNMDHGTQNAEYQVSAERTEGLDAEALAEAGVIDQATADSIAAYAAGKHERIHARYSSDMSQMTPTERHTLYQSFERDGSDGDSVEELLAAGLITEEQAAAIRAYLN